LDREAAFAVLRAHAKQLEHEAALAWVASVCQDLGVTAPPSPVLDWDEIRALRADGVTFASHTRNHPLLTRVPNETARAELADARRDLERELGVLTEAVAYPSGAFDDEVVRIAREEGYRLGFTTVRGVNPLGAADPMRLRRINVGRGTSRALLRGQLSGLLARIPGFRNVPASG
jgi:hypothetical protein